MSQMAARNISQEQVYRQLQCFSNGFPFLKLAASATVGNGIMKVDDAQCNQYMQLWDDYCNGEGSFAGAGRHKVVKFVPASGAASRMFKDLYSFLEGENDEPRTDFEKQFFGNIHKFAFCAELNEVCQSACGSTVDELMQRGRYRDIVRMLLTEDGMNYGQKPKALLTFHKAAPAPHKAFEEHLVEGAAYAACGGKVDIHFTVSADHLSMFEQAVGQCRVMYEGKYGVNYRMTYSEQLANTDTIAADEHNRPFRDEDGKLLFRPGGHGALIHNLNQVDADVVFIKNIDNIVPAQHSHDTILYKKVLGGVLVDVQQKIFEYISMLDDNHAAQSAVKEAEEFVSRVLCITIGRKHANNDERQLYLLSLLERPLRVCGMVRNEGEPGGGPFLVYDDDGNIAPQILESSQIDKSNERNVALFKEGTHFNPVDLVCAIKDKEGRAYNLLQFVDQATGFISEKSKNGRKLKALELPGLWNGAMSRWNTVFVEVPLTTFNPVKTVNDLLRPAHQSE